MQEKTKDGPKPDSLKSPHQEEIEKILQCLELPASKGIKWWLTPGKFEKTCLIIVVAFIAADLSVLFTIRHVYGFTQTLRVSVALSLDAMQFLIIFLLLCMIFRFRDVILGIFHPGEKFLSIIGQGMVSDVDTLDKLMSFSVEDLQYLSKRLELEIILLRRRVAIVSFIPEGLGFLPAISALITAISCLLSHFYPIKLKVPFTPILLLFVVFTLMFILSRAILLGIQKVERFSQLLKIAAKTKRRREKELCYE